MDSLFPTGVQHYLVGGLLIGAATAVAFVFAGLVTGMSTVFSATWSWCSRLPFFQQQKFVDSRAWRAVLALGLVLGAALYTFTIDGGRTFQTAVPLWQLAVGGAIGGFGARLGNGCTSGHGICGMGSLQLPSILAVCTFLTTAMLTAQLVRALGGA